ncbi:MAG: hypothetical protein QOD74_1221 [Variibacter sp.]|jgi:tripartite-type tricarboxylate transporter receptor subunit TctC|nr:hypothetical protein [Variibacter sp.]
MMTLARARVGACLAAAILAAATSAHAEEFPARPLTLIVPFTAGGSSDVIARVVAERMGEALGQRIVIENVAGAGGSTALARAARAAPDGYTLVIGNAGTNAAAYALYRDLKYTPEAFVPVGLAAKTVGVIAVRKDFPPRNLAEFLDYARNNPGKVSLGHAGLGSSNYLICMALLDAAKVDVTLVSYRGAALALNDAIGGQIDGICDNAASVSGAIQSGNVRGLVVPAPTRLASLPDVPTAAEAGLPEFSAQGWNAIFVPSRTPGEVISKLNTALQAAVADDKLERRLADLGTLAATREEAMPDHVRALIPPEIEKFRRLLKDVKL